MKRLFATLLTATTAFAADTFSPLILNSDLTLPNWATNFFTANNSLIPAAGGSVSIATNAGTGWATTLISPYSSGGTNSTPTILQPTLYDDITLAELTASRVLTTDASKILSASSVTTTELGYLAGVTSSVQSQISGKATVPTVGTLSYSGSDVTVTAGKGPLQEDTLTAAGNFNLLFTGLATRDAGTILVWPAATNCTVTLPSYAFGPSGGTLTIAGGTGNTNHTEIAWKNLIVGGTNRVSVNALNYYR